MLTTFFLIAALSAQNPQSMPLEGLAVETKRVSAASLYAAGKAFKPFQNFVMPVLRDPKQRPPTDPSQAYMDRLFDRLHSAPGVEDAKRTELEIWDVWLDTGSDAVNLILKNAIAAQEADDPILARQLFDRAALLAPQSAETYNRRATLLFVQGHIDLALKDLEQALKLEPRHFGALTGLGLILEDQGQEAAAFEAYRRAVSLHPYLDTAKNRMTVLREKIAGRSL